MDIPKIIQDFPVLKNTEIVYLDSTATSLKPISVIQKEQEYYTHYSANVHRGIYKIAEKATEEYESTRKAVAQFIHANQSSEVIFTRGTTEALNLVATSLGNELATEGKNIVTTIMEHHSNFVPWQQVCKKQKTEFRVIDVNENGYLDIIQDDGVTVDKKKILQFVDENTVLVAFTAVSNTLGTINPVKDIISAIKEINPRAIIIIDAAQAAPHTVVDVQTWGADFVAFSAHKMLGPTGVGVLWGRKELLDKMTPYQYGGEMVLEVGKEDTTFKETPHKFEAGTPNIAGVIAFKEAILYLQNIGMEKIRKHEHNLISYALTRFQKEFGEQIKIVGPLNPDHRAGILTFMYNLYHSHDIAQILDESNICVRAGHHCTMPLHKHLGIIASTRASFYIYNTEKDIDALIAGLQKVPTTLNI